MAPEAPKEPTKEELNIIFLIQELYEEKRAADK